MKKKIGIITDSSTGLNLEEIKKNSDLVVVPLVIIDENTNIYEDNNIDIDNLQIYEAMIENSKVLKTSQTNPERLKMYWSKALEIYDQVLFLPIAQDASGQYNTASAVLRENSEFKDKVVIYETGAASVPLKAMVLIALKLARQEYSIEKIIKALDEFRITYKCFLAPNNLSFLLRGGRFNAFAGVASFLRLKVILACKEKIKKEAVKRTMDHAIKEMLDLIVKKTKDVFKQTLYIIDGWCDEKLLKKAKDTALALGFKKIKVEPLCNILQTHTGDNTIGFSVVPNKWDIEA